MTAFAEDYFDARGRFLAAAAQAALPVETIRHPTALAPDGRALAVDVARAGREDASHILFTVCGTHGVEGYPGSAAMVGLLESGKLAQLPEHVAMVFLHGLNPYGWSRDSQRNEDGIDINRNFIDFAVPPEPDRALIDRFAKLIDIEDMSYGSLDLAMRQLWAIRDEVGGARFMHSLGAGQYVEPRGIKFGGSAPSWSNGVYRDVVRRYLHRAERIAELDWHTGLGDYGGIFPLCFADEASEEYRLTAEWWGAGLVERGRRSWSVDDPDAPTPDHSGLTHAGLVAEAPNARIAGGVVEFGTLPVTQIFMAVFLDHWLLHRAPDDMSSQYWRAQMRIFLAPRERSWERSVMAHANRLYDRTIDGLARWDHN